MAEQDHSDAIDTPEMMASPIDEVAGPAGHDIEIVSGEPAQFADVAADSFTPASDVAAEPDLTAEPSGTTDAPDEFTYATDANNQSAPPSVAKAPLGQRLADAFREGMASTRSNDSVRPSAKSRAAAPPSSSTSAARSEVFDWAVRSSRTAASAMRDKTVVAIRYAGQLAGQTPGATQKLAQAVRDGAASVRGAAAATTERMAPAAGSATASASAVREKLSSLFDVSSAARQVLGGIVAAVNPGSERAALRGIRLGKRRIVELYAEVGREAVEAWGEGPVVTDKLSDLFEQVKTQDREIQRLTEQVAAIQAQRAAEAEAVRQRRAAARTAPPVAEPSEQAEPDAEPDDVIEQAESVSEPYAGAVEIESAWTEPAAVDVAEAVVEVENVVEAVSAEEAGAVASVEVTIVEADEVASLAVAAAVESAGEIAGASAEASEAEVAGDAETPAPADADGAGPGQAPRPGSRRAKRRK
ncbi:MAG: hypothetical protein WCP29_02210 [Acidobacteriota bacterium]